MEFLGLGRNKTGAQVNRFLESIAHPASFPDSFKGFFLGGFIAHHEDDNDMIESYSTHQGQAVY